MPVCTENHISRSMNSIEWNREMINSFMEDEFDNSMYDNFIKEVNTNQKYLEDFIKNSQLLFDDDGNLHDYYYKRGE